MTQVLLQQQSFSRPEGTAGIHHTATASTSALMAGHCAAICNTLARERPSIPLLSKNLVRSADVGSWGSEHADPAG